MKMLMQSITNIHVICVPCPQHCQCASQMSECASPPESPVIIGKMDHRRHRYPCCIVWTPLPLLTQVFCPLKSGWGALLQAPKTDLV